MRLTNVPAAVLNMGETKNPPLYPATDLYGLTFNTWRWLDPEPNQSFDMCISAVKPSRHKPMNDLTNFLQDPMIEVLI